LDLFWDQANSYCANLNLAGYSGWRLPTIDKLPAIYQQTRGEVTGTGNIKGGIRLSEWSGSVWSSSPGKSSGPAAFFTFNVGWRDSQNLGADANMRALCVRHS
jgi:hypothetical protein